MSGRSYKNAFGEIVHYDDKGHKVGKSVPDLFGGYKEYDADGHKVGRTDLNVWGDRVHYDQDGHKVGRSVPDGLGGYRHYDENGKRVGRSYGDAFGGTRDYKDSEGCYIATCVYGSYDCPEVWMLRRFRDDFLRKSYPGKLFVMIYYKISPVLVKQFGDRQWFRAPWKRFLDRFTRMLRKKGVDDWPYTDRQQVKWKDS